MKIDWHRKADADGVGESASVLLRPRRAGLQSGLESIRTESVAEGSIAGESERIERLGEALAQAQPMVPEGEQAGLRDEVLAGARSGLAKLHQGESPQDFTLGEHVGLEAVILTNGERPSLFVRDGFVDLKAPDVGDWNSDLDHFQKAIRKVTASVGRIDVPVKPWFAGTCFAIAEGLVMTNRHVLEEIAKEEVLGKWTLNWPEATTVDFVAEDGATAATKFKITGVAFAGPDPILRNVDFSHLDMAILRVDPASDESAFPKPVIFETDAAQPKARRDVYVVGFAGQPRTWHFGGIPPVGHEAADVIASLFNSKFGVKRLAPGIIKTAPGEVQKDVKQWICAHDASTLGGNSGSCVVDLGVDGLRIMALHFAGANREQNWAHAVSRLHDQLSAFSATFVA